jgi:alginate O-acetyltransferase complex protein AlgI
MLFPTGEFLLLFLPVTLAVFFAVARFAGPRLAAAWLVVASVVFYGTWRTDHVLVLAASIVFNYFAGGAILAARRAGAGETARRRLVGALAVDLAALAYYKYTNFFIDTLAGLGVDGLPHVDVSLPLGISFFTFTQIAYLVDVYAGRAVERSAVNYALFVTYFPHLIAGPVLHHAQMMPQFNNPAIYRPALPAFATGGLFLLAGMVKKVLVADSFAPVANDAFAAAATGAVDPARAWAGVLAYTNQIYFDFSGYSDMAIGLGLLIGVRLPFNFNSPYKAQSIVDFWRRWHMTLSAFLRDYLYIALGGNRRGPVRRYVNLLLTMLLGGLWHGASWTFVAWGALHGAYLVLNHGWRHVATRLAASGFAPRGPLGTVAAGTAAWLLTMAGVIIAWVFFRADGFASALTLLAAMAGQGIEPAGVPPPWAPLPWLVASCVGLLVARTLPNTQQVIDVRLAPRLAAGGPVVAMLVGCLFLFALLLAAISESRHVTEFIYFNF